MRRKACFHDDGKVQVNGTQTDRQTGATSDLDYIFYGINEYGQTVLVDQYGATYSKINKASCK